MTKIDEKLIERQQRVLALIKESGCRATEIDYTSPSGDGYRGDEKDRVSVVWADPRGNAMGNWDGTTNELTTLVNVLKGGTLPRPRSAIEPGHTDLT